MKQAGVTDQEAINETGFYACRRQGSRWFASLYWLHRDLYELAKKLTDGEVLAISSAAGETRFAGEYKKHLYPYPVGIEFSGIWPWWNLTSKVGSFHKMVELVSKFAEAVNRKHLTAAGTRVAGPSILRQPGVFQAMRESVQATQAAQAAQALPQPGEGIPWLPLGLAAAGGVLIVYLLKGKK
jgi:hypothetical protein